MPKSKNRKEQKTKAAKRKVKLSDARNARKKELQALFDKMRAESETITDSDLNDNETTENTDGTEI